MRRAEVVAFVALILVVVFSISALNVFDENEVGQEVVRQEFNQGEWVVLDNAVSEREQRGQGVPENDIDKNPFGNYSGVLELRIDSVTLWDSPEAAGVSEGDIQLPSYLGSFDEYDYCEIAYTVKNISAKPFPGSTKSGRKGFNNSCLLYFEGIGQLDQIYFDGMVEGGSLEDGDGNIFYVAPGEERSFLSGNVVERGGVPACINVGAGYGVAVRVNCDDQRSEAL